MIGTVVGNYKIVEKIGEGGMGQVFRAVDLMLERDVAMKMLHRHLIQDANRLQRFRSEAMTLAKLNHPNIATLYSFFEHQGDYYMVMEFVDGETFERLIRRRGTLPARESLELFCQALQGFEHAHARRVIHRDIKPSNLMLNSSGVVKITDFGIARVLGTSRMTRTGALIGTLEYMSPEQVRGAEPDERSDIYSLGILLYEIVTGRVPFSSTSDYEVMRAHLEEQPIPPRTLAPGLPPEVEQTIELALEKNPAARLQSVQEFRKILQRVLERLPEDGRVSTPTVKPTRIAEAVQSAPAQELPRREPIWKRVVSQVSAQVAAVKSGAESVRKRLSPRAWLAAAAAVFLTTVIALSIVFLKPARGGREGAKGGATPTSGGEVSASGRVHTTVAGPPSGMTHSTEDTSTSERKEQVAPSASGTAQITENPMTDTVISEPRLSKKVREWTEAIPYTTQEEKTASLTSGQRRLKQRGQAGVRKVVVEVTYQDGREISRRTVLNSVVKAPVAQVVLVGTGSRKEPPSQPRTQPKPSPKTPPPPKSDSEPPLPPLIEPEPPLPPLIQPKVGSGGAEDLMTSLPTTWLILTD